MKTRFNWKNTKTTLFSVMKATEGGMGYYALTILKEASIPCRKAHSCYVGQVGVEVPEE